MADTVVFRRAGELMLSNLVWTLPPPSDEFRTGRVHIDAADVTVKSQTAAVYRVLDETLAGAHAVHQRVHLRDLRDYAGWAEVVAERFPHWRPATTVFGEGDGLPAGAEIAVEVIATEAKPESVGSADPFPAAVRADGWIFTSAVLPDAHDQGTGLGARTRLIQEQTTDVWKRLLSIVEEAGGDSTTLLKQNGYTRFDLKEFTHVDAARRELFARTEDIPPATTVQVADLAADLQFEAIAAVKGAGQKEGFASGATFASYTPVTRYRDVVFTSGELSWEPGLVAQGRAVLGRVRELLALGGADAHDLARANFYVRDRRFAEALHRLTEEAFGSPAFVDTTVEDCGPYEACLFELDAISAARPR
jgi:enamine deaminase RidA (YjgF/YER057c/UK114 family)